MPGTKNKDGISIFIILPPPVPWGFDRDSPVRPSCVAVDSYIPLPPPLPTTCHEGLTGISDPARQP